MKRSDLVKTLDLVSHALAGHDLVPMFKCFSFDSKYVTAYSDAIAIMAPCETNDTFALNGATLLGLLKNSHAEEVEFSIQDKQDVSIKTGKSRFRMPYFTKEEFLFEVPEGKWTSRMPLDEALLNGLSACLSTSSTDLAQPAWLGVHLRESTKGIDLYGTDGDALTRFQTVGKRAPDAPCLMPNIFCEAVLRTCKETECKKGTLSLNDEWALAKLDTGYSIYGRLIKVDEPIDFEAEIKNTLKGKPEFTEVPKGLDHALSRARVIADPESAKTVLDLNGGKLRLTTETQMGQVNDTIPFAAAYDVAAEVSAAMVQRAIGLCNEIAILEGCTVYRHGAALFMVVSNMG
jgi:DNA polymerase III sliding clamp (beta) subunit (PCNA family)